MEKFIVSATVADALRRPTLTYADVARALPDVDEATGERAAIELKFEGYIRREEMAAEKAAKTQNIPIPDDLSYAALGALSLEAREKLTAQRPRTLGAAGRIPGVTPSDLAVLSVYVQRRPA